MATGINYSRHLWLPKIRSLLLSIPHLTISNQVTILVPEKDIVSQVLIRRGMSVGPMSVRTPDATFRVSLLEIYELASACSKVSAFF